MLKKKLNTHLNVNKFLKEGNATTEKYQMGTKKQGFLCIMKLFLQKNF
jgi:hypothetical protein